MKAMTKATLEEVPLSELQSVNGGLSLSHTIMRVGHPCTVVEGWKKVRLWGRIFTYVPILGPGWCRD